MSTSGAVILGRCGGGTLAEVGRRVAAWCAGWVEQGAVDREGSSDRGVDGDKRGWRGGDGNRGVLQEVYGCLVQRYRWEFRRLRRGGS
ncbi:MAG: hypothetical protein N2035_06005 [Chthoniobacterales bacterium]|nr:hypothetical protein [Chthoniobacterales bacterium]